MSDTEPIIPPATFTPEEVHEHLSSLREIASMLEAIIATGDRSPATLEEARRLSTHISVMCNMDHISSSGTDTAPFMQLHRSALAWLAQN